MEQLFDLPAHPLLVHVPVVVVPVVTLALVWWVLIPKRPKGLPLVTVVLALIAGVGLMLASSSGEAYTTSTCYGTSAVLRMSLVLFAFHIIVLICIIPRLECCQTIHDGIWPVKVIFIILAYIGSFWIP